MKKIQIGKKRIGQEEPCFIIAEAGVNHNGDESLARKMIDIAQAAGADAVKFQTFRAENLATREAKKAQYQELSSRSVESQLEMLKLLELPHAAFHRLARYARDKGIEFLSSPFDLESADLLEKIKIPAYKIPSGELTNTPLLERIASIKKPVILSTGMADISEIHQAVSTLQDSGCMDIILLHCISMYPAPLHLMNLKMIPSLAESFNLMVGLSDHTEGSLAAVIARSLGACVIEKHFTLDRTLPGPDHRASASPRDLQNLIRDIRLVDSALGNGVRTISVAEEEIRDVARKSLVARHPIPKGASLTEDLITAKRPGTGISPSMLRSVIGRRTNRAIKKDTILWWDMFA